jgi:hypothetical protein
LRRWAVTLSGGARAWTARRAFAAGAGGLPELVRDHALFLVLLLAGVAMRVVTQLAYDPALVYYDSARYLANAESLVPSAYRPLGYPLFLRALPLRGELAVIPLAQHLMGLGIAVVLYVVLLRLDLRRWVAALATVPVLLDAYQLNIEEYILSETLFDALLIGACALILWRRRPTPALAAAAGLLLAGVAITRANGIAVIAPAVLAVALLARRPAPVLAVLAAFAAPIAAYAIHFHAVHGSYAITNTGGHFLYARVAPIADCSRFSVPRSERGLCPRRPLGRRLSVDEYMWSSRSPYFRARIPRGKSREQVAGNFARRVIVHQTSDYARTVASGLARSFSPTRTEHRGETPIARWQFPLSFPIYSARTAKALRTHGVTHPRVRPALTTFLHSYQRFGYVSNLLLGAGLVAALLAAAGLGRARRSGLRVAALLFALMSLAVLVPPIAVSQFTWRYALPQLVLIPPAMAIGLTALLRGGRR